MPKKKTFQEKLADALIRGGNNADEAKQMAIEVMEQTRWIPVSERLPEEYGEYLISWICDQQKKPLIAISECEVTNTWNDRLGVFDVNWLYDEYMSAYTNIKVIAWMPLPEPYKAESEE